MAQYGHIAQAGKVIMYDYGKLKNKRVYGQSDPPVYDLSKITLPVYLFYGENDLLATPKVVAKKKTKIEKALLSKYI